LVLVYGWAGADVADAALLDMGLRCVLTTLDEHILRILGEGSEGLFASDIAERLNKELRPDSECKTVDVAAHLKGMSDQVAQLPDGRWMLKRLML
jgi:hypothetical protein